MIAGNISPDVEDDIAEGEGIKRKSGQSVAVLSKGRGGGESIDCGEEVGRERTAEAAVTGAAIEELVDEVFWWLLLLMMLLLMLFDKPIASSQPLKSTVDAVARGPIVWLDGW